MGLPPLVDLLDVRSRGDAEGAPIQGAVHIPLDELLNGRMHELPAPKRPLRIAAVDAASPTAFEALTARGRSEVELTCDFSFGPSAPCRLWMPNAFLATIAPALLVGRAADIGCGAGRDALYLASLGFDVTAIDVLPDALDKGRDLQQRYLPAAKIEWVCADAKDWPQNRFPSPIALATMFAYLNAGALAAALDVLEPGGSILIECFTCEHRERHGKPRDPALIWNDAAEAAVHALELVYSDDAWRDGSHTARRWYRKRLE